MLVMLAAFPTFVPLSCMELIHGHPSGVLIQEQQEGSWRDNDTPSKNATNAVNDKARKLDGTQETGKHADAQESDASSAKDIV